MLEWKLQKGGNEIVITTAFGKVVTPREKWIDLYRKRLLRWPKTPFDDVEIVLTTAEEELEILKELKNKSQ